MARFYNTSQTNFVDYTDLSATKKAPSGEGVSSIFGDLNAIPDDRPVLDEILQGYESEINEVARQLQRSPNSRQAVMPQVRDIKNRVQRDLTTGRLRAIQDRYDTTQKGMEMLQTNFKDSPGLYEAATQSIVTEPLNFDRKDGSFGRVILPDVVTPITTKDYTDWLKGQESIIQEDFLGKIKNKETLDRWSNLYERGELYGVVKDDVVRQLTASLTPDMLRSAAQERTLRGDTSVDEMQIFNPDGSLNLNTTYGQRIDAAAENIARTTVDSQFIKDQDEGKLAYMKEGAKTKGASDRRAIDGQWLADKMLALRDGNAEERSRASKAFVGRSTEDGGEVLEVLPDSDGQVSRAKVRYTTPRKQSFSIPQKDGTEEVYNSTIYSTSDGTMFVRDDSGTEYEVSEDGELMTTSSGSPKIAQVKGKVTPLRADYTVERPLDMAFLETIYGEKKMSETRAALDKKNEYDESRADMKPRTRIRTPLSE